MLTALQTKLEKGNIIKFKVKIIAKSSKNKISGNLGTDILKIKIAAPASKGKANEELLEYLSEVFARPKKNISIINGFTAPLKIIEIKP